MVPVHKVLGLGFLLPAIGIAEGDLRVTLDGVSNGSAPLYFSLYDDAQAFEQMEEGIRLAVVKSWAEHPSVSFTDLPSGRYVVAAFQDLNGNGQLDTNLLGRPTEPYALSGTHRSRPPSFDQAAICIHSDDESIRLQLRN